MNRLTKFQEIALPLVRRGFPVTPVQPDAKAGAAGKWNRWQYLTEEQVLAKYVEKYSECNAGVVGMRGLNKLCFLDDDGGIPSEIIARLPKTYTVATRPDGSHRHYYFTQTLHSLKRFGENSKTINVRDTREIVISPKGWQMYKTLFDVKGIGGASLVVAAGSTKLDGTVYTCLDDAPVAEIPPWLIDWVLEQKRIFTFALNRISRKNRTAKRRASKIDPETRASLRRKGHPDGFDIFPIDLKRFAQSQACRHARLGATGETLVDFLVEEIETYVEGGTAFCKTDNALDSLWGIARQAVDLTKDDCAKDRVNFYENHKNDFVFDDGVIYGDIPIPLRQDVIRDTIREFPDRIPREDAEARLADGMNLVGLEPYGRNDKNAVSLIRKELGFEPGPRHWIRVR